MTWEFRLAKKQNKAVVPSTVIANDAAAWQPLMWPNMALSPPSYPWRRLKRLARGTREENRCRVVVYTGSSMIARGSNPEIQATTRIHPRCPF